VLFGEVVELYRFEGGFGDAFGAVVDGGDGCLADKPCERSDAAGGALVEVGGVPGEGAGFVVGEVEGVFDVGDDVAEGFAFAVSGGIRVRTWVASWLMAGVRMVTNAE
jgi:hypothetical protein